MYPTETIVDIREIIFSDKEKEKTNPQLKESIILKRKMVGMFFFEKGASDSKSILENFEYIDKYSGRIIDFYCAGYNFSDYQTIEFNYDDFFNAANSLSQETNWNYSGNSTELVILDACLFSNGKVSFYYKNSIAINLSSMLKDNVITDTKSFLTELISLMKENNDIVKLSKELGDEKIKTAFFNILKEILSPKEKVQNLISTFISTSLYLTDLRKQRK